MKDKHKTYDPDARENPDVSEADSKVSVGNAYGEQSLNNAPLDAEALYIEHTNLLLFVGARKFRIPDTDCENLIQEAFLSYLQSATPIENSRAWLVAKMCDLSRQYWRVQAPANTLPADFGEQADPRSDSDLSSILLRREMRAMMSYLQPRCRETLWLHYVQGRSAHDAAKELGTTNRYTEKLIHNCLKRMRELYLNIQREMPVPPKENPHDETA